MKVKGSKRLLSKRAKWSRWLKERGLIVGGTMLNKLMNDPAYSTKRFPHVTRKFWDDMAYMFKQMK